MDTSIAMGIKPVQIDNQMNSLAQMMQLRQMQQENEMNGRKMQQAQREAENTNRLNSIYSGAMNPDGTIDRSKLMQGMASQGLGSNIQAAQKGFMEADKARSEADKSALQLAKDRADGWKADLGTMAQRPDLSRGMVEQRLRARERLGLVTPEFVAHVLSDLPDDPELLRRDMLDGVKERLTPEQMFTIFAPKPKWIDDGQTTRAVDENPNSPTYGKPTGAAPVQMKATPGQVLSANASMANAGATRAVAQATRDAAKIQRDGETERKMGDDYRSQSKSFGESTSAFKQLNATLATATTSPAATLAAATKFMKILDPGSVVRESELGMALAASGVLDRASNYVNTLQRGKVLTATQAADFKNISKQMYKAAQSVQQSIDKDYQGKAKTYGLRPEMVTQELGQNEKLDAAPVAFDDAGKEARYQAWKAGQKK